MIQLLGIGIIISVVMVNFSYLFFRLFSVFPYLIDKVCFYPFKKCMKHCGHDVFIRPFSSDIKGVWNLSVGDYTTIPKGTVFYCTEAPLTIGKRVTFGPKPTIITGDHRIDVIGRYIQENTEKLPENDAPVIIEDDVWVGANVTILKGVKVGRGSVIAAGTVVTKNTPPYSIVGGVPARVLKYRFSDVQIIEHEKKLSERKI